MYIKLQEFSQAEHICVFSPSLRSRTYDTLEVFFNQQIDPFVPSANGSGDNHSCPKKPN